MLKVRTDCKLVCDFLLAKTLEVSQLALDRGSTISEIEDTEKNSKAQLEHAHTKTKKNNDDGENIRKNLVSECDNEEKEERAKFESEYKMITFVLEEMCI